jgi:pimeloyl-ACP methyl ester carboxylesterase
MARKNKQRSKSSFSGRHWHLKHFLVGSIIILAGLILLLAVAIGWSQWRESHRQNGLQSFYDTAGLGLNGPTGQVVRQEPLGVNVQHGSAERILYRTQRADGTITFSSGMIFIPDNSSAGTPRPVVAWAHGTVGMGDQCAPSRIADPVGNVTWVEQMLAKGWVVTATDYAGLGTPGTEGYLVGGDEARDVLNSVRALRYIPGAHAGNRFAVWGHSQGGHSALFTASNAAAYAPELHLVGTVASAPAAELVPLLSETNGTTLDWVIGPEVLQSWPAVYPNLNTRAVTTGKGYDNYRRIANQCITQATLGGLTRHKLGQKIFNTNLVHVPAWRAAAQSQTAPVLKPNQPLMVAESLDDQVVLPNTTALYMKNACSVHSDLTTLWLSGVGHIQLANVISPQVIGWIGDRFAGLPAGSDCGRALPITPATVAAE